MFNVVTLILSLGFLVNSLAADPQCLPGDPASIASWVADSYRKSCEGLKNEICSKPGNRPECSPDFIATEFFSEQRKSPYLCSSLRSDHNVCGMNFSVVLSCICLPKNEWEFPIYNLTCGSLNGHVRCKTSVGVKVSLLKEELPLVGGREKDCLTKVNIYDGPKFDLITMRPLPDEYSKCIMKLVQNNPNEKACEVLKRHTDSASMIFDECLTWVADRIKDKKVCSKAVNPALRQRCLKYAAEPSSVASCAEKIGSLGEAAAFACSRKMQEILGADGCQSMPVKYRESCYIFMARETKDPNYCLKISRADVCISQLAMGIRDHRVCDLSSSIRAKADCHLQLDRKYFQKAKFRESHEVVPRNKKIAPSDMKKKKN